MPKAEIKIQYGAAHQFVLCLQKTEKTTEEQLYEIEDYFSLNEFYLTSEAIVYLLEQITKLTKLCKLEKQGDGHGRCI